MPEISNLIVYNCFSSAAFQMEDTSEMEIVQLIFWSISYF